MGPQARKGGTALRVAFVLIALAVPLTALAQQAGKVHRVGILSAWPFSFLIFTRQFPEALRERGYVEGRQILLDWRFADGRVERLDQLVAELIRAKADVIVALTNPEIAAAKRATTVEVRRTDDVARVLEDVRRWRPDALYVVPIGNLADERDAILGFAAKHRLPAIYTLRGWVNAGGLMVYTPSPLEASQRAARYVDRVLRGARPADLPVEQPQRFDFVINLKTAEALGLTIPPAVLLRAELVQ